MLIETSAGGERVRAYVPAPLPPKLPLEPGRFMHVYERAVAAVGRLDGVTTILPSTPLLLYMYVHRSPPVLADRRHPVHAFRPLAIRDRSGSRYADR